MVEVEIVHEGKHGYIGIYCNPGSNQQKTFYHPDNNELLSADTPDEVIAQIRDCFGGVTFVGEGKLEPDPGDELPARPDPRSLQERVVARGRELLDFYPNWYLPRNRKDFRAQLASEFVELLSPVVVASFAGIALGRFEDWLLDRPNGRAPLDIRFRKVWERAKEARAPLGGLFDG